MIPMKPLQIGSLVTGVVLAGLGVSMVVTNPSQTAYEEFATQSLIAYLKVQGCNQAPFGLKRQCPEFLDANRAVIHQVIAENTQRQDYLFFSHYQTNLSVRAVIPSLAFIPALPSYTFGTIGAFENFYTYQAKRL